MLVFDNRRVKFASLAVAIALVMVAVVNTPGAVAKRKAANERAGTYAAHWDWNKDSDPDFQNFASFLKTGEVLADGPLLPVSIAETSTQLGQGHGAWKFVNGKYRFRIAFGEPNGGTAYWLLSGNIPAASASSFNGTARLQRFLTVTDTVPDIDVTVGLFDDEVMGTNI